MSTKYLRLTIIWFDEHMLEFEVEATNQRFRGCTNLYAELDSPSNLANIFAGYPASSTDERAVELGQVNLPGYGTAVIALCTQDSSGHLWARAELSWMPFHEGDTLQSASIRLACTPGDIDAFVGQLREMQLVIGKSAILYGTD